MKTLNEYLALPYRMELVKDPDEGGFVVSFPDLPGCITCGETLEAAESILCISAFQKRRRCPLMRTAAFLACSCLRKRQNRLTSGTFALIILFWIMM